ncbi:hypothetical protein AZE42_06688 [Rhizopogon vesiculosus]|uniref:Uncharacterized protein n=1 Tax=Rhizopogon vesiculosus TaxID=180088 RepID=A0A1J8Q8K3_9AGAM|nr:hypothetical protein AZE42_06688 [Rhizopogon vesiculosus]
MSLLPILQFIDTVLRLNPSSAQCFGALTMIAVLGPFIVRHPDVKGSIEQFMVQHILLEFTAQEAYMRSVVGVVVSKAGMMWSKPEGHSRAVALALGDRELPVRVQAALAITELIVVHDSVGKVVQDLLKLSDETDLDMLNHCMESMADCFQNELLPVTSQLTARLCESYMRLAKEGLAQQIETAPDNIDVEFLMSEGDDGKMYDTMGVAKTIGTVVSSIDSSPESDAVDFLDEMLPSLDNFVSYGTEVFKARPDYRQKVLDMYRTALTSPQLGDNDRISGYKLADNSPLTALVSAATARYHYDCRRPHRQGDTSSFRLTNLEILINAVLYNTYAALHFMEDYKPGFARVFFDRWFTAINGENKLPRVHDKKLGMLALCKLLEMEAVLIPNGLRDGRPGIVVGALNILMTLPQAVARHKELEDDLVEADNEEDKGDGSYLNLEGDEGEDVWDEDSAYLEVMVKEVEAGDDESDTFEESEIEEELGFFSLLDAINPYITFKQALQTFQNQNNNLYQAVTAMLTIEQQTMLLEVVVMAESHAGDHS